jgi:hypothetical protein
MYRTPIGASTRHRFLNGYGMLTGAIAGVMICDFWLIRRASLDVHSLYRVRRRARCHEAASRSSVARGGKARSGKARDATCDGERAESPAPSLPCGHGVLEAEHTVEMVGEGEGGGRGEGEGSGGGEGVGEGGGGGEGEGATVTPCGDDAAGIDGVNWRAFVAVCVATAPLLPGFLSDLGVAHVSVGWRSVYEVSVFTAFALAALVYWVCERVAPRPH